MTYASVLHDNATRLLKEFAVCVVISDSRTNVPAIGSVDNENPTLVAKMGIAARCTTL